MNWLKIISTTILSLSLIAAFGLHSIELKHQHSPSVHEQHHSGSPNLDIDEYVHGTEQKFFLIVLLVLLAYGLQILLVPWLTTHIANLEGTFQTFHTNIRCNYRETNYLKRLFRKGILNPKLH